MLNAWTTFCSERDYEASKKVVFLSVVGLSTNKLLTNLIAPTESADKNYKELVDKLMKHHSLKPSTSSVLLAGQEAWRICCYYVAELHTLAIFCNFEATLNKMLRDRLVAGSATCKFADGSRERLELCQSTRDCAKLGSS